jgi:hypothetical protein
VTICCDEGEKYLSEYFIPGVHAVDAATLASSIKED